MFSRISIQGLCKFSLILLNGFIVTNNVLEFAQNSLDDVIEDIYKFSAHYLIYTASSYFFAADIISVNLPIYLISYHHVDRYAEKNSDHYIEKFINISQNSTYSLPNIMSENLITKKLVHDQVIGMLHPYGYSEICNFIENNVEDITKIGPILAVLHQDSETISKFFTLVNTYVHANEWGDKIGDLVELNCNFMLNITGYLAD